MRASKQVLLALSVVAAVGCSSDPAPTVAAADPGPVATATEVEEEPTESVTPDPPVAVEGTIDVLRSDLSPVSSGLHPDGAGGDTPVPADDAAIDRTVTAAAAWVDEHLTDLQAGGGGLLADAGLAGDVAGLAELTDPDHPITGARYAVMVGVRGVPEWVRVQARLARAGDANAEATFVFLPDGDGVRLLSAAIGPAASTAGQEAP